MTAGALADLKATFVDLKKFDQALLMLLAFLIYNDGIGTIIRISLPLPPPSDITP